MLEVSAMEYMDARISDALRCSPRTPAPADFGPENEPFVDHVLGRDQARLNPGRRPKPE